MMEKKIPYPKSVFFIVVNEFCERFSYYGMKAILTIYFTNVLMQSEDTATIIYHVFSGACYFTPLLGAVLADSFLGKFKTILYLSIVYSIGNIVLSLAATPPLQLPTMPTTLIGLSLIALGTGGIKPCVSAFGGDQFKLPEQEKQLSTFFSIFYFSINAGSLISTTVTPIFRQDVSCFGSKTCYPLAFGVPALLMIVALMIFVIGKPWYVIRKSEGNIGMLVSKCIAVSFFYYKVVFALGRPIYKLTSSSSGNLLLLIFKCVKHAISNKKKLRDVVKEHWLDYADDVFEKNLIEDVKILLRILVLYIPLPVFWALFDQQGSRWTLQATKMDGQLFGDFIIKPDQMQVVNPLLILSLIPIFDQIIYPGLAKLNLLKKPLQRLTVGGVLAGIAFVISGILELNMQSTYSVQLNPSESHINLINTLQCTVNFTMELNENKYNSYLKPNENVLFKKIQSGIYKGELNSICGNETFELKAGNGMAHSFIILKKEEEIKIVEDDYLDELEKSKDGNPRVKIINLKKSTIVLLKEDKKIQVNDSKMFEVDAGEYSIKINETNSNQKLKLKLGGNYVVVLKNDFNTYTITEPNSVHMLWLLPQYFVMTVGEVMFSVTGLEFSFAEAPTTMKSVIQASWLLTVAFGNILVVFVTKTIKLNSQANEFFLFAGIMFLDMVIFAIMAYFYKKKPINKSIQMQIIE